jgi:uncharacterized membrane protein YbaN (DUF454 family)
MDQPATPPPAPESEPAPAPASRRSARLWRALGTASVAVGLFNAFVPLLPTTIFLIIGLWAYGKGSPELRAKLLEHPRFGPTLRNWVERRAMTRVAKLQCVGTIALGYLVTLFFVGFTAVTALVGVGLGGLCLYLLRRPEPDRCPVTLLRP